MAFTPDPYAMLGADRFQAAKSKAQTAADTFGGGPRYDAQSVWGNRTAARPADSISAYTSGTPAIDNVVTSSLNLPQGNSAEENALYTQAGADALKGMMSAGLSSMPQNFSTLQGIADQSIDSGLALDHQQAMNKWKIKESELGAGGSAVGAVLNGVGQLASFGSSQGWFGGGSTSSVPSGASFFSASNPVTYGSGFGTFG